MKRNNERFLAYAVALAASFAVVPGISYAAASAAAPSAADTTPAAASTSGTNSTQTDAAAAKVDKRTQEWAKNRPEDKTLEEGSKQYEGQTIVDTQFEGTTALTQSTAKAAISMRTGDMFTYKGLSKDRDAIYNAGYFYDL